MTKDVSQPKVDLSTCPRCGFPTVSRQIVNDDSRWATVHMNSGGIACDLGAVPPEAWDDYSEED